MKNSKFNIEQQLRQAIIDSPLSRYELSRRSEIAASQLCYFVNGHRTLRLDSAAKVAEALGLELTTKRRD